ncbi:MAG: hypothetical protein K2P99_03815 [Burkholderiales bacterium]|nr:hypothetical protein [Burkholderiales bacterium]
MTELYKYIVTTIISVVIVLIGMIIIRYNQPSALVKIDLVAITTHYTELMSKDTIGGTNNDNAKKISDAIKVNLEPIISSYAQSHNVVVIQAQALVDGRVTDITEYVIKQLDKKIK